MDTKFLRGFVLAVLSVIACVLSPQAYANQPAINWLETQYAVDGSYGQASNIATAFQSTSEIINAYQLVVFQKDLISSVQYLDSDSYDSCEYLSRKLVAHTATGQPIDDLLIKLVALQNTDGGFGEMRGYDSTPLDTAIALNALAISKQQNNTIVNSALTYLLKQQQSDGGYPLKLPNVSAVYNTALVTLALQKYGHLYALDAPIARANAFISSKRIPGAAWDSNWETAIALRAIAAVTPDLSNYTVAVEQFRSAQMPNGSWDNDIYVTALAIQTDYILSQRQLPVPESTGGLSGKTIDANTGAPLEGVLVRLDATSISATSSAEGIFGFNAVEPGNHTLSFEKSGYTTLTRTADVTTGVWADAGVVSLIPIVTDAIISGMVTDGKTGLPISGAIVSVTGLVTTSATTGSNGSYQIVTSPGLITISVDAAGYQALSGTGTVTQGSVTSFSPALLPLSETPSTVKTVTVKGVAVDADTGASLSGVGVYINDIHLMDTAAGVFQIDNATAGMITIDLRISGYQSLHYSVMAPEGSVLDLGYARMQRSQATTTTVSGIIVDDEFNTPIAGAEIRIQSIPVPVLSDANGEFQIENIAGTSFSVTANAAGYLASIANVGLSSPSAVNVTFRMKRAATVSFDIVDVHTYQNQYEAMTEIEVDAVFSNTGTEAKSIIPYLKVISSSNEVVEKTLSKSLPVWPSLEQIVVPVPANSPYEKELAWNTNRFPPGIYTIVVQAYDASSDMLLAERSTQIEILSTRKIGGSGSFDPPLTHLSANNPVRLKATITNQGNSPIDATTVTARVKYKNQGYVSSINPLEISVLASENGIQGPDALITDLDGNILVVNKPANSVSRIGSDGVVSLFAGNLVQPVDIDIDSLGNVYILQASSYVKITPDGQRKTVSTGITQQKKFKVLDIDRLIIARADSVYEVNGGQSKRIVSRGLGNAQGVAVDSKGRVYIASPSDDSIMVYANGMLSTFISGINTPYGIAVDNNDDLIVTGFSNGTLLRITQNKLVTTIASGLAGPFDVKIDGNGDYLVSNNNTSEIIRISAGGVKTVIASQIFTSPKASAFDPAGNLYVGNYGTNQDIVKFTPQMTYTRFSSASNLIDLKTDASGGVHILDSTGIKYIDTAGVKLSVSTRKYSDFDISISDQSYYGVISGNIEKVNNSGVYSIYSGRSISTSDPLMRAAHDGGFYILSSDKLIKMDIDGHYTYLLNGTYTSLKGIAEDGNGTVYVTDAATKRIISIDGSGNAATTATLSFTPGAVAVDAQGTLYVAQQASKNVYALTNGTVSLHYSYQTNIGYDLLIDSRGNLWASHSSNARISKLTTSKSVVEFSATNPRNINESSTGGILVSSSVGVIKISESDVQTTVISGAPINTILNGVASSSDGRLLVMTSSGIIYRYSATFTVEMAFSSVYAPTDIAYIENYGLIVLESNSRILKVVDPGVLPELVAITGSYLKIAKESPTTLLLANNASVARFDLGSYAVTQLVNGLSNMSSVSANPLGGFVITDDSQNMLSQYGSDGSLINKLASVKSPRGLLIKPTGEVLVANNSPNQICLLRANGTLVPFTKDGISAQYMTYGPNNNLFAVNADLVTEIDGNGDSVSSSEHLGSPGTARGIAFDANGVGYVSNGSKLHQYFNGVGAVISNGISVAEDIATDAQGNVYITDSGNASVSQILFDGSIKLILNNVPNVKNIVFAEVDSFYISYNAKQIASYNAVDGLKDYKVADVLSEPITALEFSNQNLIAGIYNTNTVVKVLSTVPVVTGPVVGDLLYSITSDLPSIPMSDMKVDIDFGLWQPANSGDYEIEVSVDDGLTAGKLVNALHVGAIADGTINLSQSQVFTGDRAVTGHLSIKGLDTTGITTIDPNGIAFSGDSGVTGDSIRRSIVSDIYGNAYVADYSRIARVRPDGVSETFITGSFSPSLATDSFGYIYTVDAKNTRNILRIDQNGQSVIYATLPLNGSVRALDVNHRDILYALDQNGLYKVNSDGSMSLVRYISDFQGLTIDAYGNFYVTAGFNPNKLDTRIIRISPDGKQASVYFDNFGLEIIEGINVTADCSNNLLFAPFNMPPYQLNREEEKIIQLVGATGEVREVLYGPPIDNAMRDMDMLRYDRFGQRLLIWTDLGGKMFSFPVVCGGLDVEAHVITRNDVDLSSTDPAPSGIHDNADGTREYVWQLSQVDSRSINIQLNLLFKGLNEAETRAAFKEAYLQFSNTFEAGNFFKVPLAIPTVTANTSIDVQTTLDASQYPAFTDVNVNAAVSNNADVPFNGQLNIVIRDEYGYEVEQLSAIGVTNVQGNGGVILSSIWNTGSTYAGTYSVDVKLLSDMGYQVASDSTPFTIIAASATNNSVISNTVNTDRQAYQAWDQVDISGRVRNESTNVIQLPTVANLSVVSPDNVQLYSETFNVRELYAGSYQDINQIFNLVDAQAGQYQINLSVHDAATDMLLSSDSTIITVGKTASQALTGNVKALPKQVTKGTPVVCETQVINKSASDVNNLQVIFQVADMSTGATLHEERYSTNVVANSNVTRMQNIPVASLDIGEYACVLLADTGNDLKQLAASGFRINQEIITISLDTQVNPGTRGRLLVLMDTDDHDDDGEDSDSDESNSIHDDVPLLLQRAYLESYLAQHGWTFTVVTDSDAFAWEMRHGGYSAYALLSEEVKLDEMVQKELREAVYHGDGLLVAGSHDERNHGVDAALGIKYLGQANHYGWITLMDSPLNVTGEQLLSYSSKMERTQLVGARIAGIYYPTAGKQKDSGANVPASNASVTYYEYGRGHSVFAAFDLLSDLSANNQQLLDDLLSKSLDYVHPRQLDNAPGKAVPVTVTVSNTGPAATGRVLVSIPAGVEVIDAGTAVLDIANHALIKNFDLAENAQAQFTVLVKLPEAGAQVSFHITTQSGQEPDWVIYSEMDFVINMTPVNPLADVIDLARIYSGQDKYLAKAYEYLTMAQNSLVSDPDKAVQLLLSATNELSKSTLTTAITLRLKVDEVIASTARLIPLPYIHHDDD